MSEIKKLSISEIPYKNAYISGYSWRSVPLTKLDIHFLQNAAIGKSNDSIAKDLGVVPQSISRRSSELQKKLGMNREGMIRALHEDRFVEFFECINLETINHAKLATSIQRLKGESGS